MVSFKYNFAHIYIFFVCEIYVSMSKTVLTLDIFLQNWCSGCLWSLNTHLSQV